jgi:cellulose synthase/poly-beta-1,6-N-acetylglucosamine synthase-like glycosyltransferase
VLRSDADIILESYALEKAFKIISSIENIGGITGTMETITVETTAATGLETTYRTFFDKMSTAESAIHSTFPGGGGFTLLRKSCLTPISNLYGSTDGNISLSIVKKGFRYIYVPQTFSYETIHHELSKQVKQKVRRASRLIQSVIMNRDLLFNSKIKAFSKFIFPLRFAMIVICPTLTFISIISMVSWLLSYSPITALTLTLTLILLTYIGVTKNLSYLSIIANFFVHQCYLLLGLLRVGKPKTIWN